MERLKLAALGWARSWPALSILASIFAFGGSSRPDEFGQLPLRLISLLIAGVTLQSVDSSSIARIRAPAIFLLFLAIVIAAELVPLPPSLWQNLPGRDLSDQIAIFAGLGARWRPLALDPDGAINSLSSLVIPLAVLLAAARLRAPDWPIILYALLGLILASAMTGLVQAAGGDDFLYLYRITNPGAAVGLMANRNHQATLITLAFPLVTVIALRSASEITALRLAIAGAIGLLMIPLILVTGSKAGLAMMLIALICSSLIGALGLPRASLVRGKRRRIWFWFAWPSAALLAVVAITTAAARADAIQRLFTQDMTQEQRFALFEPMLNLIWRYFPFGTGFGGFVDAFKIAEPFTNLSPAFWNHAHNDPLEFVIEGGLPAIALLTAAIFWWARCAAHVWSQNNRLDSGTRLLGRLGSILAALLALASFADYPLRTPIGMGIFFLAAAMMERAVSVVTIRSPVLDDTERLR